ncbi:MULTISPECIES: DUF3889 domain-containing protein [Bacillus]|uniref:DUF3889 domain-containing protein n=2 Tax=Bacillus TaxID=1386 RepID=A0A0M4FHI4_9BACI|nr:MULTISPECIES: DUF3889 domain-containing protein [Bacillus]ALC80529.1 hypothetical protein AM592_02225 [Bacillus gobiensis]MBP1083606.1 hypothetical protein [Bacillus capparidis]MED1094799.1 DUF3889 domain-containing protein [Bacillus capparidis]
MKRFPFVLTLFFCVLLLASFSIKSFSEEGQSVAYDRWKKIAWGALEDKFKGSKLTEYKYIGRTEVNKEQTKDVFRVTVKRNNETYSAHAEVYFDPLTKNIIAINVFRL